LSRKKQGAESRIKKQEEPVDDCQKTLLLASCFWLLLLASDYLLLASDYLLLASDYLLLASGYLLLASGYLLLDSGF
jgi:hypothetical protein